jgi:hypothetical protein
MTANSEQNMRRRNGKRKTLAGDLRRKTQMDFAANQRE